MSCHDHDEVIATLKNIGKKIGDKARDGCELSKRIIRVYKMYSDCPDSCTLVILDERIKEWLEKYPEVREEVR